MPQLTSFSHSNATSKAPGFVASQSVTALRASSLFRTTTASQSFSWLSRITQAPALWLQTSVLSLTKNHHDIEIDLSQLGNLVLARAVTIRRSFTETTSFALQKAIRVTRVLVAETEAFVSSVARNSGHSYFIELDFVQRVNEAIQSTAVLLQMAQSQGLQLTRASAHTISWVITGIPPLQNGGQGQILTMSFGVVTHSFHTTVAAVQSELLTLTRLTGRSFTAISTTNLGFSRAAQKLYIIGVSLSPSQIIGRFYVRATSWTQTTGYSLTKSVMPVPLTFVASSTHQQSKAISLIKDIGQQFLGIAITAIKLGSLVELDFVQPQAELNIFRTVLSGFQLAAPTGISVAKSATNTTSVSSRVSYSTNKAIQKPIPLAIQQILTYRKSITRALTISETVNIVINTFFSNLSVQLAFVQIQVVTLGKGRALTWLATVDSSFEMVGNRVRRPIRKIIAWMKTDG